MTKLVSVNKCKSSTQIVARQHMKKHLKRIRDKEYGKLRDMVPAIAKQRKISKVEVIEQAVRYIDELHKALASRLGHSDSNSCEGKEQDLKEFVHSFIPADFFQRRPAPVTCDFEKQRKLPSFITQRRVNRPAKFV
ncbi:uncharacterized protein LOC127844304 [Dreissena polymorpha]|uniref:BHLH domain-containing protein n=1 Tax=Dreissena polymorpha TaxID=45954 RepID=A0A9D4S074_DREPO|nr:uncharacterized protein LOC127844304 [Dreissena polymorpha]KAH3887609.1 hypothetical protein DPMN_011627 [Dreissena polymorpha]